MMMTKLHIIRGNSRSYVPASHEDPNNPGCLKKVLLTKDELRSGQVQMINWSKLPSGKSFSRHYHEDMDEVFIILTGKVSVEVDGQKDTLSAGDTIVIPAKSIHSMTASFQDDVEYLALGISFGHQGKTVVV